LTAHDVDVANRIGESWSVAVDGEIRSPVAILCNEDHFEVAIESEVVSDGTVSRKPRAIGPNKFVSGVEAHDLILLVAHVRCGKR
jgi:hypothetical protein